MGSTAATIAPVLQFMPGQTMDELLSKYSPAMYRAAFRQLGNVEDAEDALQDALLSAARNLTQFKGECHISTWLVAIAINAARMQLRRKIRQKSVSLDQNQDEVDGGFFIQEPADHRPNPEQVYRVMELQSILSQLAAQLSPPLRRAFRKRVFEGLSVREAARSLGVTEGTLKAQFFRARARIRERLRPSRQATSRIRMRKQSRRSSASIDSQAQERSS